jgi:hypothetical protein
VRSINEESASIWLKMKAKASQPAQLWRIKRKLGESTSRRGNIEQRKAAIISK